MSFLNLRSATRSPQQRNRQLTDLPESILKLIFSSCSSVDMTHCSLVNRQFRELIEDMEDEKSGSIRSCQKAKIFICDRRRAILEGVSTITPTRLPRTPKNSESCDSNLSSSSIASTSCSSSESGSMQDGKMKAKINQRRQNPQNQKNETKRTRERNISDRSKATSTSTDSTGSQTTTFISDQYTNINDPHWAYAFNFEAWLQEYEVNEVYLKNFCSFFEREKIDDPMSPSSYKGRTAFYETKLAKGKQEKEEKTYPYDGIAVLPPAVVSEIKMQSAGRIERLVERLSGVRAAHFNFKDSVCYGSRHPATIFYFLGLVRENVRSLTFDHVQAADSIPLDEYVSLANLHRLTVNQPDQRAFLQVSSRLLTNWLNLEDNVRKRISIHLVGCTDFGPTHLMNFVHCWLNTDKPRHFKQIAIDGGSYKYNDFMDKVEVLQNQLEKRPPRSPVNRSFGNEPNAHSVALERICRISHPMDRSVIIQFKYCKPSRRMVLTLERDPSAVLIVKALSPVSTLSRLTRPQSAAAVMTTPIRKVSSSLKPPASPIPTYASNKRHQHRPFSHHETVQMGCRENVGSNGSGMFNRLVSFLGTSS